MEREFITKAICLNSVDYKEKDKQLILFSLENGLMSAVLKGCKTAKAKLKFAFSPFCFAEYSIVQKGNFCTITNAGLIDSFFDLTSNYDNYILGSIMLDITHSTVKFNEQNLPMFVGLLNHLKAICYENINAKMVCIKFVLLALENLGYKPTFKSCHRCGMPFNQDKYLDMSCGEFVCQNCKNISCEKLTNAGFSGVKILNDTPLDRLSSVKLSNQILDEILTILLENFECRVEHKLPSKKLLSL